MTIVRSVGFALLLLAGAACAGRSTAEPNLAADRNVVEGEGTVVFMNLEGGFYALRSDAGVTYDPRSLPEGFKTDGLRVRFKLRVIPDAVGFHQVGPIVEVLEIHRLK